MRNCKFLIWVILLTLIFLSGCATQYNPATRKEEFSIISSDREVGMGQSISKEVEKKYEVIKDQGLNQRVDLVGEKLASVCDRKDINYRFSILDEKEINAFALPGGYVYIFKGLLDLCQTDDELAAVLAHELGHITARHAVKRLQSSLGYTALSLLAAVANPPGIDGRSRQVADLAFVSLMLAYSREDELQADDLSIRYMERAGYDPKAVITVLEKLRKSRQQGPIRQYSAFRTHPYISERIKSARQKVYGHIKFEDYINVGQDIP
jgi:predicted Zn-dependent protease